MADKEIRLGDISNGDIPSPDAKWAIDGSGNLVITTPNGVYSFDTTLSLADQTTDPTVNGEVQLNGSDVKVYSGGAVRNLSDVGAGTPGGSDTQLQYNDGGAFGGIAGFTYDDVATTLTGIPSIDAILTLADQATDPTANGEFSLNGSDVKVFSGGSVKNLSNIGTGSGGVDVEDDTTLVVSGSTAINFGTGLDVTDDGDTTATVDATGGGATDDSRIQMFARRGVSA
jgi:hypothetical protein